MTIPTTPKEFSDLLKENYNFQKEEENNLENFKYVIYIRKSTDEQDKQIRSVDDQIAECKEFAEKENLFVKDIL